MKKFEINTQFPGYSAQIEESNTDPRYLVPGSLNVIIDQLQSISSRRGYTLLGTAGSTANGGVQGKTQWRTSRGQYHVLMKFKDKLQVLYKNSAGVSSWNTIMSGTVSSLALADMFSTMTTVWDATAQLDKLIISGGVAGYFSWNGALAEILSATANTITKTGTESWSSLGFGATGSVRIGGVDYAYTGGASTTTLTGVTPNASGLAVGSVAVSLPSEHTIAGLPSLYTIDYVGVFKNGLYVGCSKSRIVKVSAANDFTNFVTSTAVGGAREFNLDDNCAGFEAEEKSMVIFGQEDSMFRITYIISSDQTKEFYEVERLITAPQQGLISPYAKTKIRNATAYITREKTLDTVGNVANITSEQTTPISDFIKTDFDALNFNGSSCHYWRRNLLIAVPENNLVYMRDLERNLWQPPQRFSGITIKMFATDVDGNLIGFSSTKNESYIIFDGYSDNENEIDSQAVFAYNNFGTRFNSKSFTLYAQDGYITAGGTITRTLDYNYRGALQSTPETFSGNSPLTHYIEETAGFGKAHLGSLPLSGSSLEPEDKDRRFRFASGIPPQHFYELRVSYAMKQANQSWRLVAHGCDLTVTTTEPNDILIV